jgi:hypothetical protein
MNTQVKIITSFALAAAGAFPAAAFGVSAGGYWTQIGTGYVAVSAAVVSELWALNQLEETKAGDPSRRRLEIAAITIGVAYPVVTAGAIYFSGEVFDGPSANKTRTWGLTTLAATGQSVVLIGIGYAIITGGSSWEEATVGAVIAAADICSKPFTTAFWYNRFKEPASEEYAESRLPSLAPYVAVAATADDGRPLPLYGATISF